jgi:hypothetical protein
MHTLVALIAMLGSDVASTSASPPQPVVSSLEQTSIAPKADRFAGRPQARIAFAREVRNFQVKRDGTDDILYLETQRNRWFRSEIYCTGINDPRDAQGLLPIGHSSGLDRFSRIALVDFSHRSNECQLVDLIELTPEEAIELRLVRRRAPPAPKAIPAS